MVSSYFNNLTNLQYLAKNLQYFAKILERSYNSIDCKHERNDTMEPNWFKALKDIKLDINQEDANKETDIQSNLIESF